VCAIAYFLERAGIRTTGVALVRENAASMQPPRMLWVSFPLGRPLGVPGDATFQHEVIAAALALLERDAGPVLEDFERDLPPLAEPPTAPACPVNFARADAGDGSWRSWLLREHGELAPFHELSCRRRGRTTVGVSGRPLPEELEWLARWLDEDELPVRDVERFKLAIEDAKAFWTEALTALPGAYDPREIQYALWHRTMLGAALTRFYQRLKAAKLGLLARLVAPREAMGEATGTDARIEGDSTP
jgi:D-proline reductase (dithiol) PrdB